MTDRDKLYVESAVLMKESFRQRIHLSIEKNIIIMKNYKMMKTHMKFMFRKRKSKKEK